MVIFGFRGPNYPRVGGFWGFWGFVIRGNTVFRVLRVFWPNCFWGFFTYTHMHLYTCRHIPIHIYTHLYACTHTPIHIYTHYTFPNDVPPQVTSYDIVLYSMHVTYAIHCTTHDFLYSAIQYACHICYTLHNTCFPIGGAGPAALSTTV